MKGVRNISMESARFFTESGYWFNLFDLRSGLNKVERKSGSKWVSFYIYVA
jgi:hypothetical protein